LRLIQNRQNEADHLVGAGLQAMAVHPTAIQRDSHRIAGKRAPQINAIDAGSTENPPNHERAADTCNAKKL
jgi:hypothetical protein